MSRIRNRGRLEAQDFGALNLFRYLPSEKEAIMSKSSSLTAGAACAAVFYLAVTTGYPIFALRPIDTGIGVPEVPTPALNHRPEPSKNEIKHFEQTRVRGAERRKQATAVLFYHLIGLLGSKQL